MMRSEDKLKVSSVPVYTKTPMQPQGRRRRLLSWGSGMSIRHLFWPAVAAILAIVGTLAILKIVDMTIGLRVSEEEEIQGLDLSQHGEEGYYWEASA